MLVKLGCSVWLSVKICITYTEHMELVLFIGQYIVKIQIRLSEEIEKKIS